MIDRQFTLVLSAIGKTRSDPRPLPVSRTDRLRIIWATRDHLLDPREARQGVHLVPAVQDVQLGDRFEVSRAAVRAVRFARSEDVGLRSELVVEEERRHARPDTLAKRGRHFDPGAGVGEVLGRGGVVQEAKVGDDRCV